MSKSDQKRIGKQAEANSAQAGQNAQTAFTGVGQGVSAFQGGIGNYQKFLDNTYGPNGTFFTKANDVAQASEKSLGEDLNRDAQRTGVNTANFAPTEAEAARQAARDQVSLQSTALDKLNAGQQFAVGEEAKVPQMWEGAYGQSLGAQDSSLNTAQKAENQKPWWQTTLDYAIQGANTGVKAAAL